MLGASLFSLKVRKRRKRKRLREAYPQNYFLVKILSLDVYMGKQKWTRQRKLIVETRKPIA